MSESDLSVTGETIPDIEGEENTVEGVTVTQEDEDDDAENSDDDSSSGDNEDNVDEDGSDSDIDEDALDEDEGEVAEDDESPVEIPYITLVTEDIPAILNALESENSEECNLALAKLTGILYHQTEFVSENVTLFEPSRFVKLATTTSNDVLRNGIVEFISNFPSLPGEVGKIALPHIPDLIPLLGNNDPLDRQNLMQMLEQLAEAEPSSHQLILDGAKLLYQKILQIDADSEFDEAQIIGLVESFESTLLGNEICKKLFIQASAFDAILAATTFDKSPKIRLAAQSCLTLLVDSAADVDAFNPNKADRGKTIAYILCTVVNLAADEDEEVSSNAAQYIARDQGESDAIVFSAVISRPQVVDALILQLSKKAPGTVSASCEYALLKFLEDSDTKKVVIDRFRQVWDDESVPSERKLKVICGLIDSFVDLRKVALEGGLCQYIMKASTGDNVGVEAMTILDRLMDTEQLVGYSLLESEGCINHFVDILQCPSSEARCIAASILSRTFDSYKDSVSYRPAATVALTGPNVYPRVIAALHSEDYKTVNAAAKLLSEILSGEEGSQTWNYEVESGLPPPSCPLKDDKVTDELAHYAIGLLKNPETQDGGLNLLCQCCWGYQRGFEILKNAFETHLPDADAFFFAALYGEYVSRHSGRQRRVVADAAVQAGALARASALLEEEHKTVEVRRAAVEGYRVLLCADSVDRFVARKNMKLPTLLTSLLADRTVESLRIVNYMIRLLSDDETPDGFDEWTEVATPETVHHLIYWIDMNPPVFVRPSDEGITEETFKKEDADFDARVAKANEESESILTSVAEIISNTVSILLPYSSQLLGPILHRTNTESQNSSLLQVLSTLSTSHAGSEVLVSSIQGLLTMDPPPSVANCHTWILSGTGLATGFYRAGVVDHIFKVYDVAEEDEDQCYDYHEPLRVLQSLLEKLDEDEHIRAVQVAFFANEKALARALAFLRDIKTSIWGAWQAADELGAFTKAYPEGVAVLESENIYPLLLQLFNHKDLGRPGDVGPLLGRLCHLDPEKLTDLLRSFIVGLEPPVEDKMAPVLGKKGKKNNKKFRPRISVHEVLERFLALVSTTPVARQSLVDAGAIDLAKKTLELPESDEEMRTSIFTIIQSFVEEDNRYTEKIAALLPQCANLLKKDEQPLLPNILAIKAFLPNNLGLLIDADAHRALVKVFTDFPSSVGDMSLIIDTVVSIAKAEGGAQPLIDVIKESLEAEDALEQEPNWGNSHALRRLLDEGELAAKIVADAGAVEYSVRLMQSDILQLVVKGSALAGSLVHCEHLQVRPKLIDLGALELIQDALVRCTDESKKTFSTQLEGDEAEAEAAEHREKVKLHEGWVEVLSQSAKVVGGEVVENYEENYFL